ncbi:type III restriction enzyme [Flammula alnicola]|nr:type III restriction enzyme [Flammula alnicola]
MSLPSADGFQPVLNDDLLPRRYQEEVFERAQKGNIIAALNTGSGKTLISLLLIKWITSLESSRRKAIIFLVPKVTLVEQQAKYLSAKTPLRITKLHGALDLDLSDRRGWKKRFEDCDVLVMTAQIFLNVITHSLWSIDKVSLMIFDECHHARKNHPYNSILREYFQVKPPHNKPKIFGMTASPIWSVKDPLGSITTLEENMDAKVIGVRENIGELLVHSPKAQELIKEYPFPPENFDYPSPTIYECFQVIDRPIWDQLDIPWSNIEVRYLATLYNLGPYCASLYLYLEIQHHIEGILIENKHKLMDDISELDEMDGVMPSSTPPSKKLPEDFFLILDILLDFKSFFPPNMMTSVIPIAVNLDWCTPKVKVLVDILLEYHTATFQGIIFVEQRQVASSLSKVLQVIPELSGKIRCAFLVGQGVNSDGVSKQTDRYYDEDPVKLFRKGVINILIATSVAEEGLDFPKCDLVVRFDTLHHMIGYVQSRGRARKKASTFIVMLQKGDVAQREKYRILQEKEPEINQVYQTRHGNVEEEEDEEDDGDDESHAADLLERERYVVPSTGAILTYDNSLNLLNYLCSLIPRDAFTPVHVPKFAGDFQAMLRLPRALPLALNDLIYVGPPKRSKKEAKRAVAFMAVKRLRKLDVFDEYLLPVPNGSDNEEIKIKHPDGKKNIRNIPPIITVPVRDPWCMGQKLWLHPIMIDGQVIAGLVTGTALPMEEVMTGSTHVKTLSAEPLTFDEASEHERRADMKEFTRLGIWHNNTSSPFPASLSFYLVPITQNYQPDFEAIRRLVDNPRGSSDWSQISDADYDKLIVLNFNRFGSTHLLRRIRHDLSPMSSPLPGSREAQFPTYRDYWLQKWSRKAREAVVPKNGPLLETFLLPRSNMGTYELNPSFRHSVPVQSARDGRLLPQGCSTWLAISYHVRRAFEVLPVLCHHMTSAFRARCARYELGLPLIPSNLMIEAFTIPSAALPFSNQRMETLGDAVLQLCTTVHLLNQYPNRHEGQLSKLRQKAVSNKYLMHRALDLGFESFVNSEIPSVYKWRYVLPDGILPYPDVTAPPVRYATREFPRRSLQDCMEAILGASFLAGSIPVALQTGTILGLEFGGPLPWPIRYHRDAEPSQITSLFAGLENNLGYRFQHNHLLLESLTHPSFSDSEGPSYQRLEFLGDAILDLVVVKYLYDKFPHATSHQLAFPRTKAICAPTLANLAVRRLGLHKMMLVNNLELNLAIDRYVPLLEEVSGQEIVKFGWKFDPPKAISDVFESLVGAILVDSGYDYEKTAGIVEYVMEDVLESLSPDVAKDPISDLIEWMAGAGCMLITFEKRLKKTEHWEREGFVVLVHGEHVVGPIVSTSLTVAKFLAAERAIAILKDSKSEKSLTHLCDCGILMDIVTHDGPTGGSLLSDSALLLADKSDLSDCEGIEDVALLRPQAEKEDNMVLYVDGIAGCVD